MPLNNSYNLNTYIYSVKNKGDIKYEYNPFHNYLTATDLYLVTTAVGDILVPKGQAVNSLNGLILTSKNSRWVDKYNNIIGILYLYNSSTYLWEYGESFVNELLYTYTEEYGWRDLFEVSFTPDPDITSSWNTLEVYYSYDNEELSRYNYTTKRWDGYLPENVILATDGTLYAKAGSLIDFDTDKLNFDLRHPVDITILPSYDGSVNLILNDDKNPPRLINSRFSVREKNTYEVVDRIGENDTNIYNSETFDKDTSLYFQYLYNPKIYYERLISGVLPVGQYCFYFTYCDADENESDFIAESGLIPVFIGDDGDPNSMDGGIKNQNSNKGIKLKLTNLDKSYNYLKVYYVRYFADYLQNRVYNCNKIYRKYPINSSILYLNITGNEEYEELDPNILNLTRFSPNHLLTLALCKNMLFFGNIVKNSDNYRELLDCALRIVPTLNLLPYNGPKGGKYSSVNSGYYRSNYLYNNTGYFNNEYYRFGVVFIYLNGTLSNVYNTLGGDLSTLNRITIDDSLGLFVENNGVLSRLYIKSDENGWITNENSQILGTSLNSRGVCKIIQPYLLNTENIIGINFNINEEVKKYLREELNIRGFFIVRQKRIPNILAQCLIVPFDTKLKVPIIEYNNKFKTECFLSKDANEDPIVTNNYLKRLYEYETPPGYSGSVIGNLAYAAICPDFLLNLPYFNQIFNGGSFKLRQITEKIDFVFEEGYRNYYSSNNKNYDYKNGGSYIDVKICTVTEDVPTVAIENQIYKLKLGEAEEAYRFEYVELDNGVYNAGDENWDKINKASNLARGIYSPYLAIYSENNALETNCLYEVYKEETVDSKLEYQNRMDSSEPFYAISDRYNFDEVGGYISCWRGDCFINIFTHRLNRNFNDPSLPNNDKIIDQNTWKEHYKALEQEEWTNISRSDINAVQMGSWITFSLRSPYNYALRSNDSSYVSEEALMGNPRSYFPRSKVLWVGDNKMPDSYLYNDAYRAALGFKCYFTLQNVNYIKDTFSNRILYSAISIQDSFKNNYRYSLSTYYRDYSQEYGGIMKLIGFEGHLLVVFEHAIGIAVVNERVLVNNGEGEPVFINTGNVLPEELTIITDTYGSQWPESVVKSEMGYVYGVDTIAKKIWRVKGQEIEILSDFKVNKFLIDNISLNESELYPIIGLKNVKTHYNNNKKDIMFTFYDDVYKDEEKVWNLCFNELVGEFITFYSWLPSYSENIDTQYFSFDRNTSKLLSLISYSNYNVPESTGVLVDLPIIPIDNSPLIFPSDNHIYSFNLDIGTLHYRNNIGEEETSSIEFELENDHWNNCTKFFIILKEENGPYILQTDRNWITRVGFALVSIKATKIIAENNSIEYPAETIAVCTREYLHSDKMTTDFYLHGKGGIIDILKDIYPTFWYEKLHPFEFEFVVNDKIGLQKIFNNLVLISNKAEPESFHFEIEGDNYEFSPDKRTMYFRQEATKNLYLNLGSDILYDRKFTDVAADPYTMEQDYRTEDGGSDYDYSKIDKVYPVRRENLVKQVKSSIFPLYYSRVDTYDEIYHAYKEMTGSGYDFKNLSGSEVVWNRDLNQFDVVTHIKNSPIPLYGRLRGNSYYKEGKWNVLIPSIIFNLKNEDNWVLSTNYKNTDIISNGSPLNNISYSIPPIVVNNDKIPEDLIDNVVVKSKLPNIYLNNEYLEVKDIIDTQEWTARKEARIRDKWMKIRVRYSGKNLAIIHSIITLYTISYA